MSAIKGFVKLITDIFKDKIEEAVEHIASTVDEELSKDAKEGLSKVFEDTFLYIAGNTLDGMCRDIIARRSPFAAFDMSLCTREQIREASDILMQELKAGKLTLPETLMRVADERCLLLENALCSMFSDLKTHKLEICDTLFGGRQYTRFLSITAGAGDYHNGGRSVTILETELGRMVYKPRSLMLDVRLKAFTEKYFPDCVYIPRCYTDGKTFGVSEYLGKSVASTREEAKAWYRRLGGLAAMFRLLGSYDMHHENLMAVKGVPAIIDPETVLIPQVHEGNTRGDSFDLFLRKSLFGSALMPAKHNGSELSILADTDSKYSSAPVVNGKSAGFEDYQWSFFEGFREAYRSCLDKREELEEDIPKLFSDVPLRVIFVNSQYYGDLMVRTWKRRVLDNENSRREIERKLEGVLSQDQPESEKGIIRSEKAAILRSDIPCFYTYGGSTDLYADGENVYPDGIRKSGTANALDHLADMSEEELSFEEDLIRRCFTVRVVSGDGRRKDPPRRKEKPLSSRLALKEAEELFTLVYDKRLTAPDGAVGWFTISDDGSMADPVDAGLGTGITGIGLFAAALHSVSTDAVVLKKTQDIVERVRESLMAQLLALKQKPESKLSAILPSMLGEASGFGGILRGLVLMERYQGSGLFASLIRDISELLFKSLDFGCTDKTDRIGGIAGLIAALCAYPELSADPKARELTAFGAGRLMELKNFNTDGHTLWNTISKRHLISGAGHGMMGIAHALFTAGTLLGESAWIEAAEEAVAFELEAYSDKLKSWPDRRSWPPEGVMHGYCSGAPGIGILCKGMDVKRVERIAALAASAVDGRPLLFRDHLCCGNSAIVEYYLTAGRRDEAGRVLSGMRDRKKRAGGYRLMAGGYMDIPIPTLLYGYSGVGYEMLRYAYTDKIYPVFG